MKTLILSFLILIASSTVSLNSNAHIDAEPSDGFKLLNSSDPHKDEILEIQKRAIQYLDIAIPKMELKFSREQDQEIKKDLRKLINLAKLTRERLLLVKIYISTNESSEAQCRGGREYLTHHNYDERMYLCKRVIQDLAAEGSAYLDSGAQLFIHEGGHLAYFYNSEYKKNECDPTVLELEVMDKSVGVKTFANRDNYRSRCGDKFARFDNMKLRPTEGIASSGSSSNKSRSTR